MPHVAILFEFSSLNGGEHSMLSVLRELQKSGNRFSAIAPADGPLAAELAFLGIEVVGFSVRNEGGVRRPDEDIRAELFRIVQTLQPDVLHANSLSMSRLTGRVAHQLPDIACTGHLRDIMRLNGAVIRDLNRNYRLAAVSHATRDYHVAQGLDEQRCCVVYNGVDTTRFAPSVTDRRSLLPDISDSARVLLNVGQICLRKGQLAAAQAVCQLISSGQDVHLVLVGQRYSAKSESVDYEHAIERLFRQNGYSDRIHRTGYRSDIPALMNVSDVLLHPARQEPFGRTLLEAASTGLPIVATRVGGTAEMLRPDKHALLVDGGDDGLICSAVTRLLQDPDLGAQLGRNARERVRRLFSLEHAAARLQDFWLDSIRGT